MLEFQDRVRQYLQMNDLEKIFRYIRDNHLSYDQVIYDSRFFQTEIQPEQGLTREETLRKYRSFVSAAFDNRYIPTELYIPEGRNIYIRKFPRYMEEHPHYHKDALEIDLVLQGEFSQKIGDRLIYMEAGNILFISPNTHHIARVYSDSSIVFTIIVYQHVLRNLLDSVDGEDNALRTYLLRILYGGIYHPYLFCRMDMDVDLAGLAMELEENQEQYGAHMNKYMEAGLRLFLLRLLVKHEKEMTLGGEVEKKDSDILNIMDYIKTNYATVTLGTLAKSYNYSPNYLSTLIRTQYGRTFYEILTEIKMQKAAQLLRETDYSMSRISEQSGFSEKSYFLKRFKKYYGMTPSQYRANSIRR